MEKNKIAYNCWYDIFEASTNPHTRTENEVTVIAESFEEASKLMLDTLSKRYLGCPNVYWEIRSMLKHCDRVITNGT